MKNLLFILSLTLLVVNSSCGGPRGLPGLDGKDGVDGESFLGSVFEIKGDFTSKNNYNLYFEFPYGADVYDTDIVLVYILWEIAENNLEVWRMLPQTRYLRSGILKYDFDYTYNDVQVFLEGDIDFRDLERGDLEDQIFRIVVLPADFLKSSKINEYENIDFSKYEIIKTY